MSYVGGLIKFSEPVSLTIEWPQFRVINKWESVDGEYKKYSAHRKSSFHRTSLLVFEIMALLLKENT